MMRGTRNIPATLLGLALLLTGLAWGHGDEHRTGNLEDYQADIRFILRTAAVDGEMAFVGVGGAIDGVVNPELEVWQGDVVEVVLLNGDGLEHDFTVPAFDVMAQHVDSVGDRSVVAFEAGSPGNYPYHCALTGHRQAGMLGNLVVMSPSGHAY